MGMGKRKTFLFVHLLCSVFVCVVHIYIYILLLFTRIEDMKTGNKKWERHRVCNSIHNSEAVTAFVLFCVVVVGGGFLLLLLLLFLHI